MATYRASETYLASETYRAPNVGFDKRHRTPRPRSAWRLGFALTLGSLVSVCFASLAMAAQPSRVLTVTRHAARENVELRLNLQAIDQNGTLGGEGRLFFKWSSPGKGGDVVSEIKATVRVDGSLQEDRVRLRVVSPAKFTYIVTQAPPTNDPVNVVHVGSTGEFPLSTFDPFTEFTATLKQGHFEHQEEQTLPAGVWTVTTTMDLETSAGTLVERLTIGGQVEPGDVFRVSLGTVTVSISAVGASPAEAAAQLATAWVQQGADNLSGVNAIANGADVWLTASHPQHAFDCQIMTTEADNGASDGQTFASSTQFYSGGQWKGLWKKEIRHCNRLLATIYAKSPSPAINFYERFECPDCGVTTGSGEWSLVQ